VERRLRIAGLHHVTLIVGDAARSTAFYRDLLGMRLVEQAASDDDPDARHLVFGDAQGRPGTLVTCLEYADMPAGQVGRGSTHHFALEVESEQELRGWREYLEARGVTCSEVMERSLSKSVYLRDPDGHVLELATRRRPA
jgi:catechol 2,3-dioxygenase-like lactoylglutathione lyase family enzyme